MKTYTIENLSTLEIVTITTADHICDMVEDTLEAQWSLRPSTGRVSWAYPFLRGEYVKFHRNNRTEFVRVWRDTEGKIWVKDI